jgi:DNA (cytosine-5)-methyltransferase 1
MLLDFHTATRMAKRIHRGVSLFSNCGAGDIGYAKAGFLFEVMAELDPRRLEVALLNHPKAVGVPGDLRDTWRTVVKRYREKAGNVRPALLAACPPCQGMSTARSDRGREEDADAGSRDKRNLLVTVVSRVTKALKPKLVVLENVQAFLTRKIRHPKTCKAISAARLLISELESQYAVFPLAADLCDFGVPQTRKRTFLTFVRRDLPGLKKLMRLSLSPYPVPAHARDYGGKPISLREALESFGLPGLDAGSPETASSSVRGGLHTVPVWEDRRYALVAAIPRHSGKSAWDNRKCESCGVVEVGPTEAICPHCGSPLLRPVVVNRGGCYRLIKGFHSSSYRRMRSNKPASTVTTASGHIGSDNTIHPFQNRLLSALECARLQTFPKGFKWGDALAKWGHTNVRQMIGEAVPPMFTEQHGRILVALLEGRSKRDMLPGEDIRAKTARQRLGLLALGT